MGRSLPRPGRQCLPVCRWHRAAHHNYHHAGGAILQEKVILFFLIQHIFKKHFRSFHYTTCRTTLSPFDSDDMALEFLNQFRNRMISVGERFVFGFQENKKPLVLVVKSMEGRTFFYCLFLKKDRLVERLVFVNYIFNRDNSLSYVLGRGCYSQPNREWRLQSQRNDHFQQSRRNLFEFGREIHRVI